MLTTLTTLTLSAALLSPLQDHSGRTQKHPRSMDDQRVEALMESKLGFTIYTPRSVSAPSLLRYAKELTDTKVRYFFHQPTTNTVEVGSRDRFIPMDDVIGIQDFTEGREAALRVLQDLDTRLGAVRAGEPAKTTRAPSIVRSIRMRTLDLVTAASLIAEMDDAPRISPLQETGTLVLQGSGDAVARAEALLREVDQPLPQITLRCALIEAVDATDTDATGLLPADDEVARALGQILPGKRFRKAGELLLRGSAGGNAKLEVTSSMPELGGDNPTTPARVSWRAIARGLDPMTNTLTLERCETKLDIPTFQTTSNGTTTQRNFAGYRSEGIQADLALRAGETTVVGSLGGDPIYVSLTFTIDGR